jgi:hypothetical protein
MNTARPTDNGHPLQRSNISPAIRSTAAPMPGKISRRVFTRRSPPNHAGLSSSINFGIQGGREQHQAKHEAADY